MANFYYIFRSKGLTHNLLQLIGQHMFTPKPHVNVKKVSYLIHKLQFKTIPSL